MQTLAPGVPPTTFDVLTKVVIPVATFVVGVVATLIIQAWTRRRASFRESARCLADLTADWYNQIDQLRGQAEDLSARDFDRQLDLYLRNRLVLPKVLYHLMVLKERDP